MKTQEQLDFSEIPVIDNHCHLFNISYSSHDLPGILNMSLNDMPAEQLQYTLVYRRMLKELRSLLGIEEGIDQEVLSKREMRMRQEYSQWVADLFADASIHTLIVDLGYKPAEVDLPDFEELVPARVYYMFRIESIVDDLWQEIQSAKIDFRQAEERFDQALSTAFNTPNMVAIKSIIGYRTGLGVEVANRDRNLSGDLSEKAFREYFLLKSIEKATEKGWPIQIHAAFGESNINMLNNNPVLLREVLEHPVYKQARIVLVHGGYPYTFEAGYLASVYPNVYVDISEMIPFVPMGARQGLNNILGMCPFSKVLYGSDGFIIPEIHWLAAKMAKEIVSSLFLEYIDAGLFNRDLAFQVANMIFFENAKNLYGLPE